MRLSADWIFFQSSNDSQVLALCLTATNTFSSLLVGQQTSIPAFQTLFNYILLNLVYTSYTIYKYGPRKWFQIILKDGRKCTVPGSTPSLIHKG